MHQKSKILLVNFKFGSKKYARECFSNLIQCVLSSNVRKCLAKKILG